MHPAQAVCPLIRRTHYLCDRPNGYWQVMLTWTLVNTLDQLKTHQSIETENILSAFINELVLKLYQPRFENRPDCCGWITNQWGYSRKCWTSFHEKFRMFPPVVHVKDTSLVVGRKTGCVKLPHWSDYPFQSFSEVSQHVKLYIRRLWNRFFFL